MRNNTPPRKAIIAVAWMLACSNALGQVNFFWRKDSFDPQSPPIAQSRIHVVPPSMRDLAQSLLGDQQFARLSLSKAEQIVGEQLNAADMLLRQARAAAEYLKRDEELERLFAGHDRPKSLIDLAALQRRAYQDFQRYTLFLPPDRLMPYLVRASAYWEGTGGFSAELEGSTLHIRHASLGHSRPPPNFVPVVVFVEREISAVTSTASVAQ
jgi:hypothetical protein